MFFFWFIFNCLFSTTFCSTKKEKIMSNRFSHRHVVLLFNSSSPSPILLNDFFSFASPSITLWPFTIIWQIDFPFHSDWFIFTHSSLCAKQPTTKIFSSQRFLTSLSAFSDYQYAFVRKTTKVYPFFRPNTRIPGHWLNCMRKRKEKRGRDSTFFQWPRRILAHEQINLDLCVCPQVLKAIGLIWIWQKGLNSSIILLFVIFIWMSMENIYRF